MSAYERPINWNLSGKTSTQVQLERRVKELEQQRDELLAALRHLLNAPNDSDAVDQGFAAIAKVKP